MEFLSPLRYPGGKAKDADFVQCLIKENALLDGTYVEPYVGYTSYPLKRLKRVIFGLFDNNLRHRGNPAYNRRIRLEACGQSV